MFIPRHYELRLRDTADDLQTERPSCTSINNKLHYKPAGLIVKNNIKIYEFSVILSRTFYIVDNDCDIVFPET